MTSAITGGVIGALAGGIPAWLLARRESKEALRRYRQQRVEREKALAFSVAAKLLTITNSIVLLRNHVHGCLSLLDKPERKGMAPWQILIPIVGQTGEGEIRFEADELALFLAAADANYMMGLSLLARRHASNIATLEEYRDKRAELSERMPAPSSFDGQIGSTCLTPEQVNALLPYVIPLNQMAVSIAEHLEKDVKQAREVAEKFGPIVRSYFTDAKMPRLTFPTDEELAAMINPPDPDNSAV